MRESPSDVLGFLNDVCAKFLSDKKTWNILEASRLASILDWRGGKLDIT
jgi:hypothetical protein